MKKRIKFRSLSMLLAALVCLTLGLSLIPSFGVATHAAEEQTYKIYIVPTSYPHFAKTLAERTTLPYTISGSALRRFIGYSPACHHITGGGGNVTIDGTNISINGEGTSTVNVFSDANGNYAPFRIEVTKNITATSAGYTGAYDGNAHGISVSVAVPSSGAEVKYGTTSGTYNLTSSPEYTDAGTYTVYYQVTAEGNNTLTGSAQVIINKATPTVTALPTASAISYGQTLADSTLSGGSASVPGTFAWKTPSTAPTVNDSNSTTFPVVFTPNDTTNYNTVERAVKLKVNPIDPDIPTGLTANYGQTLADVELPEGWAWADSSQSVGNAGTNTFKANYTPTSNNYNAKSNVDVEVTVSPIDPEIPTGLTAFDGQTLDAVTLPEGWAWDDPATNVGTPGTKTFPASYTHVNENYNDMSADLEVVVNPIEVTGVIVIPETLSVFVTETKSLTSTVTPDNATNKNVTWESSDETIATVDQDGQVTGVSAGNVTITATSEDGGLTAECAVTVKDVTFVATEGNGQYFRSKDLFFKFELEEPIEGFDYMAHFVEAKVVDKDNNEIALVDGENCDIAEGSLDITLYIDFLRGLREQNPGVYKLVVTFDIGSATATFIVPPPASTDTPPASGEGMVLVISAIALMMLAACGGVYAIRRRRAADGQAD